MVLTCVRGTRRRPESAADSVGGASSARGGASACGDATSAARSGSGALLARAQGGGTQGLGQQGGDVGGGALLYGGARRGSRAAARLAGPDGPHAGLRQRSGLGRASGSAQSGRVDILLFFSKYFSVQKQIQEMPRKCLEARKIPRKSQKFQENS
jgi:hypothetical protein